MAGFLEADTKTDFMLRLAAAAERNGLMTGIRWELSDVYSKAIDDAIAAQNWNVPIHGGWDPLHVEVTGMKLAEAEEGKRPDKKDGPSGGSSGSKDQTPKEQKRRFKVGEIETGALAEYSLGNAFRPVSLLSVPYVSQLGSGAEAHANDCGAACAVMLLRAYQKSTMTPNDFYTQFTAASEGAAARAWPSSEPTRWW